jgi:hypothetical protein
MTDTACYILLKGRSLQTEVDDLSRPRKLEYQSSRDVL